MDIKDLFFWSIFLMLGFLGWRFPSGYKVGKKGVSRKFSDTVRETTTNPDSLQNPHNQINPRH